MSTSKKLGFGVNTLAEIADNPAFKNVLMSALQEAFASMNTDTVIKADATVRQGTGAITVRQNYNARPRKVNEKYVLQVMRETFKEIGANVPEYELNDFLALLEAYLETCKHLASQNCQVDLFDKMGFFPRLYTATSRELKRRLGKDVTDVDSVAILDPFCRKGWNYLPTAVELSETLAELVEASNIAKTHGTADEGDVQHEFLHTFKRRCPDCDDMLKIVINGNSCKLEACK